MAIAAGKSAGKPPRITDNAFKPPTEAAIAMTQRAGMHEASFGVLMFLFIVLFELVQRTVSPQCLILRTVGIATLCWIALWLVRILDFIVKSQYAGKPWDCFGVFTASEVFGCRLGRRIRADGPR